MPTVEERRAAIAAHNAREQAAAQAAADAKEAEEQRRLDQESRAKVWQTQVRSIIWQAVTEISNQYQADASPWLLRLQERDHEHPALTWDVVANALPHQQRSIGTMDVSLDLQTGKLTPKTSIPDASLPAVQHVDTVTAAWAAAVADATLYAAVKGPKSTLGKIQIVGQMGSAKRG